METLNLDPVMVQQYADNCWYVAMACYAVALVGGVFMACGAGACADCIKKAISDVDGIFVVFAVLGGLAFWVGLTVGVINHVESKTPELTAREYITRQIKMKNDYEQNIRIYLVKPEAD